MKSEIDLQCIYVGIQGSGKTYKMMKDAEKLVKKYSLVQESDDSFEVDTFKVLVFDPFRQWTSYEVYSSKLKFNGLPVLPLTEENFNTYPYLGTDDKDLFLEYVSKSENTLIIVEELLNFDQKDRQILQRASSARRHKRNAIFSSTQRPSYIPQILLSSCTDIFCFRIISKDDQKKMLSFSNKNTENLDLSLLKKWNCVNLITQNI